MTEPNEKTQVEELDRVRMQMLAERQRRVEAELQVLQVNLQRLLGERAATEQAHQTFGAEMKVKYGLTPTDSVNLDSGLIMRTPAPAALPGELRPASAAPAVAHGLRAMPQPTP